MLSSFLGNSRQGSYDSSLAQYQFNCPYCAEEEGKPDGKYNFEVSLSLMVCKCWKCEHSAPLSKLIREFGSREMLREYYDIIKSLKESRFYEFRENAVLDTYEEKVLRLPKSYKKINLQTCRDKYLVNYLKKRKIDQWTINRFNIGYTPWEEEDKSWANRIIIPSYDISGKLNYYVGRDYLPEKPDSTFKRIKYKNCDADKKEIVFQENLVNWDADIYICEGAIDCLMLPNAISLLGKYLEEDSALYSSMFENANAGIIICLDSDTKIEETKRIYRLLDKGKLRGRIWYIRMGDNGVAGKDFSEVFESGGVKAIAEMMRHKKKFTEQDLIF